MKSNGQIEVQLLIPAVCMGFTVLLGCGSLSGVAPGGAGPDPAPLGPTFVRIEREGSGSSTLAFEYSLDADGRLEEFSYTYGSTGDEQRYLLDYGTLEIDCRRPPPIPDTGWEFSSPLERYGILACPDKLLYGSGEAYFQYRYDVDGNMTGHELIWDSPYWYETDITWFGDRPLRYVLDSGLVTITMQYGDPGSSMTMTGTVDAHPTVVGGNDPDPVTHEATTTLGDDGRRLVQVDSGDLYGVITYYEYGDTEPTPTASPTASLTSTRAPTPTPTPTPS